MSRKGHQFWAFGLELAQPFLNKVFLLSRTEKKNGKTFLTTNLDSYINKILFLQCVCKQKVVFLGGNIRSKSVLFGLKVCQKAPSPVCLRKTEERCCTMDEISKFCPKTVRHFSLLNRQLPDSNTKKRL